jgi:hypothetical protein
MTLLVRTPDGNDLGQIELADGKLLPTSSTAAALAKTALLRAGNARAAYDLLNGYDNGYVLVGEPAPAAALSGGLISDQIELTAVRGKHVPGTDYTFRHGWIRISTPGSLPNLEIGKHLNDHHPQWLIDREKARQAAEKEGAAHVHAARERPVPDAQKRQRTPGQQALAARQRGRPEITPNGSLPPGRGSAMQAAAAFEARGALPATPSYAADVQAGRKPATWGSMHASPENIGSLHEQLAADPALGSLAQPGASAAALKAYVDARVATEVARQVGQMTPRQSAETKDALAKMHMSQQKLISATRKIAVEGSKKEDADLQKHTVANTLFSFGGVALAIAGIATGMSPILAALAAGIVPLATTIHDYARNLG